MSKGAPGRFPFGRHRRYAHILVAVSTNALYVLASTAGRELCIVSKKTRLDWILKASGIVNTTHQSIRSIQYILKTLRLKFCPWHFPYSTERALKITGILVSGSIPI